MNWIGSLLLTVLMYGSAGVIGLFGGPFAMMSPQWAQSAIRFWSRLNLFFARWLCGIRVRVEGLENIPEGPILVAGKHQAMLDILIPPLVLKFPCFVFKKELRAIPVFGWFAEKAGNIPIDRAAHAQALKDMLRAARKASALGRQIVIYPEGTRTLPGANGDYKPGVAALYKGLNVPCVPVAANSGYVWAARGLLRWPGIATFKFLPPIAPGLSREDFMAELKRRIETESAALPPPNKRALT